MPEKSKPRPRVFLLRAALSDERKEEVVTEIGYLLRMAGATDIKSSHLSSGVSLVSANVSERMERAITSLFPDDITSVQHNQQVKPTSPSR